jgi:hypothetical protein
LDLPPLLGPQLFNLSLQRLDFLLQLGRVGCFIIEALSDLQERNLGDWISPIK